MASVIGRALKARARFRADRRALEHRFSSFFDQPEPQEFRRPPRRRRWILAGIVLVAAAGGIAAVLSQGYLQRTVFSPPAAAIAEVSIAAGPPSLAGSVPASEIQPVQPTSPPPMETTTVPLPEPVVPSAPAVREVVTAARSGANMRSEPSMSATVVWRAPLGTRLRVVEEDGLWLQVATPSGQRTGWMHRSVVTE